MRKFIRWKTHCMNFKNLKYYRKKPHYSVILFVCSVGAFEMLNREVYLEWRRTKFNNYSERSIKMEEEKQQRSWMKLHICVFEEHNSLYFFRNIDRLAECWYFGLVWCSSRKIKAFEDRKRSLTGILNGNRSGLLFSMKLFCKLRVSTYWTINFTSSSNHSKQRSSRCLC